MRFIPSNLNGDYEEVVLTSIRGVLDGIGGLFLPDYSVGVSPMRMYRVKSLPEREARRTVFNSAR